MPGHAPSAEDKAFEASLLAWLRFHEAMLIGELVPLTLRYSRTNPALGVLPALEHVLVDEYQDLNRADQALVLELASKGALLVIGDDNQSIYSFRNAHPEGVRTFPVDVPGTVRYQIAECRRCPPNIVEMSNSLIAHDPETSRPNPITPDASRPPAAVSIVQFATLAEEVATAAAFIDSWLTADPGVPAGSVLVLTPRRFIGNAIKDALIARGRNALSYFFEDELKDVSAARGFCLLSLLVNPSDRAALRAWLGFDGSDLARRPYAHLRKHCEDNGVPLHQAIAALAAGTLEIKRTASLVDRWNALQSQLAALASLTGTALVDALWPPGNPDSTSIRALAGAIAIEGADKPTLLAELREAITQPELPDSKSDIIQVMSLHKSKGLTRSLVLMAGCMAGTLPRVDQDDPAELQEKQLQEQRRLFYVGMTRATNELVISSAAALPVSLAKKGNAAYIKTVFRDNEVYALTAFSQFVGELGNAAPPIVTGAAFRTSKGIAAP